MDSFLQILLLLLAAPDVATVSAGDATALRRPAPPRPKAPYETVVSATRIGRAWIDTPMPTGVVNARQLQQRRPASLAHAASGIPGVYSQQRNPTLVVPSIRGLAGRRIRILIDSVPVLPVKTMGVMGYFVSLADLERLEVIRGPASVLYGSGALGGVINAVSREPLLRLGWHGAYGLEVATNNRGVHHRGRVGWTHETRGGDRYSASVSGRIRDGDSYRAGSGETVPTSFYHDRNLGWRLGWQRAGHRLTLVGQHYLGRGVGRASFEEDRVKLRRVEFPRDDAHRFALTYGARQLRPWLPRVHAAVYTQWTDRVDRVGFFTADFDQEVSRTDKRGRFLHVGGVGLATFQPGRRHRITAGVDAVLEQVRIDRHTTVFSGGAPVFSDHTIEYRDSRRTGAGVFAQYEVEAARWLRLVAGARYDVVDTWAGAVAFDLDRDHRQHQAASAHVGVTFRPVSVVAVTLYGARAFRAPELKEQFYVGVECRGLYCGNPDMRPEIGHQVDLGVKGRWRGVTLEVHGYSHWIDDLITLRVASADRPDCEYVYQNVATAWLLGVEARLAARVPLGSKRFRLVPSLSAAWTRGEDRGSGAPLPEIPPLRITARLRHVGLIHTQASRYVVEAGLVYHSPQRRVSTAFEEPETSSFVLVDVAAGFEWGPLLWFETAQVLVRGTNLADVRYRHHLSWALGRGRDLRVTLRLAF